MKKLLLLVPIGMVIFVSCTKDSDAKIPRPPKSITKMYRNPNVIDPLKMKAPKL